MTRKMALFSLSLLASCFIFTSKVQARCIIADSHIRDFSASNPLSFFLENSTNSELFRAVKDAPTVDVFNVSGHVSYTENIIKAHLVTFTAGSTLEFMNVDAPFWAIVAEKLVFQGEKSTITRKTSHTIPTPEPRAQGYNGPSYGRSDCCDGRKGGTGGEGTQGRKGGSEDLPCLLVIAQTVELRNVDPDTISVWLQGIDGGRGGNGGRGGDGGKGEGGANASWKVFKGCQVIAQSGGDGGDGGKGGRAGDGGDGGRGGDLIFIGNRDDGERFMGFRIFNEDGQPGQPGEPGDPGSPGSGGDRGHRNGRPCGSKQEPGDRGQPGQLGQQGTVGNPGQRGQEQIIVIPDLSFLFEPTPSEIAEPSE